MEDSGQSIEPHQADRSGAPTSPRIVVHLGAEKTGTTAAQSFAAANHGRGLWYPHEEFGGHNMPLVAFAFGDRVQLPDVTRHVHQRFGDISREDAKARISAQLRGQSSLPVFISCEYLYSRLDASNYRDMFDFLRAHSPEIAVFCVLRDVRHCIDGLITEALKTGHPVDDPYRIFCGSYGFDKLGYFDFVAKTRSLDEIFGDSLTLLRYESLDSGERFVSNLFSAMNLPSDGATHLLNTRINAAQGLALQRLNRLTARFPYSTFGFRALRRVLVGSLSRPTSRFVPERTIAQMATPQFQRDVDDAQRHLDAIFLTE